MPLSWNEIRDRALQHDFLLAELPAHVQLFGFIAGYQTRSFGQQDPVNVLATEKVALNSAPARMALRALPATHRAVATDGKGEAEKMNKKSPAAFLESSRAFFRSRPLLLRPCDG